MKIMTFNIQHALDYQNDIINIDLFINAIKKYDVDFCGLNEVRGDGPVDGYTDQTKAVADGLSFYGYFGEAIKVCGTSPYGNAAVCRYPFRSTETIHIPDPQKQNEINRDGEPVHYESRCIIKAILNVCEKDICILVTHFGLAASERRSAVNTLCNIIDSTDMPLILMGDFNTEPEDEILAPLFGRMNCAGDMHPTFPSYDPKIKIDYIFYKGLECKSSETVKEIYSDHLPIIAEFNIK